ncbi:Sodium/calcium exchanger protein-domain-containing protein [Gautieria morchelliformis]|nr:Sodium/calcium exchanger protein-domain-containing protein [Gautieria morchelliformis]
MLSSMSPRLAKVATVAFLVANCILWAQTRHHSTSAAGSSSALAGLLGKRSELASLEEPECAPWSYPVDQQCVHVRQACPETDTFLTLPHLQAYFCASPAMRPLVFFGLLVWLALLFSTLGIGASDFFCPNLATIATVLGLDENVAGVTFLAVGNGSPDVFATFSAMKAHSGSLAVGELLGAAAFIVSVVVGSMCIIKPFHVNPRPFLRDVGFFTVAVSLVLWILHDGRIRKWEAGSLVALYMIYVATVVVGSWWEKRLEQKRHRELIVQEEFVDDIPPRYYEPYRDDVSSPEPLSLTIPTPARGRAHSTPAPPPSVPQAPQRFHSRSPTNQSPAGPPVASQSVRHLPSFSLLSALEFRDVVASLQHQTTASSLAAFETPITPLGARPYRSLPSRARVSGPPLHVSMSPLDDTLGRQMHLSPLNGGSPTGHLTSSTDNTLVDIPTISDHSPRSRASTFDEGLIVPPTRWQGMLRTLRETSLVLFPHLHHFSNKSITSILVAIFATPGVLALTITSPVVITASGEPHVPRPDDTTEDRLIEFEEDGIERVLVAEDELKEELYDTQFSKWLTALQCALSPGLCVLLLLGTNKGALLYFLAAVAAGISAGVLVLVFADTGADTAGRLARCFMGFVVAVVWIMTIADEVVSVLKTIGLIFGLSDAIIGLTIFAVGNSLADLVANTSVAAFAPIMGFSACFGAPMLNILLGIGVSGSVVMQETGRDYTLRFSPTLLLNAVGLLALLIATLIFVPWNGYLLSRKWGIFLLVSYLIIMLLTVIVEVKQH